MNYVKDILARKGYKAIAVAPDTTVLTALKVMADNNIGSVVVMADAIYKGIVTERDYSRKVILKGKNSTDTKVSEIMSSELPHIRPDDTVEHCMELMTNSNIRYLPVFKNDHGRRCPRTRACTSSNVPAATPRCVHGRASVVSFARTRTGPVRRGSAASALSNPQMQPTGRGGQRSARALSSLRPESGSVDLCGHQHDGLQLEIP